MGRWRWAGWLAASGCVQTEGGSESTTLPVVCDAPSPVDAVLPPGAVEVLPRPDHPLTLAVRWTTDQPSSSVVEFGEGDRPRWRRSDDALTRSHEVVVYGLPPESEVSLRVRSVAADGTISGQDGLRARTGPVPAHVPHGELGAHDPWRRQPGWTLANVSLFQADWPPTAVIFDEQGRPVWFATTAAVKDQRGDLDTSLTPTGTVLVGGSGPSIEPVEVALTGEELWRGPPQPPLAQHHHAQRQPDGTTVMLRHDQDPDRPLLELDRIVQTDPDGNEVWSWSAFDHLAVPDGATGDHDHLNSVTLDADRVYVNSRNLRTLFALDRATGGILWRLGEGKDFAPDPDHPAPWFRHQHEPELQGDGSWLVYDNEGLSLDHSRVLWLDVDEERRTTRVRWEFPGDRDVDPWYREEWHSPIWGDADRLDNGNVLVAAGTRELGTRSRLFEVTPDGEVVWELLLPVLPEGPVGTYRAERIDPPGLEPLCRPEEPATSDGRR